MTTKKPTRKEVYQSIAKMFAFISCGKVHEAREWAGILLEQLRKLEMLP